jgi:hypothetical protein
LAIVGSRRDIDRNGHSGMTGYGHILRCSEVAHVLIAETEAGRNEGDRGHADSAEQRNLRASGRIVGNR